MSEPTVIVTGASGFIGGSLVRHLRGRGWSVRALARRAPAERVGGVDYIPYALPGGPAEEALTGARFLVHCAYVRHGEAPDADRTNVEGARALLACCRAAGVKPLFLSSFSAHDGAESHYGRTKREIERMFDPARDLILRPGLVVGGGGLFAALDRLVARRRIIPLVGSGKERLQTLAVGDLCLIVERGLERGVCGIFSVAHPDPVTLRALLGALAARRGARARFIPVPMGPALLACRLAERLRIRLPVNSDSLLGLKHTRVVDTARDLSVFGVEPRTFAESLQALPAPAG